MAWISKDVGNWYSFNTLINLDVLLKANEVIEGFSEDISLRAKIIPCVGAAFSINSVNYFYPSLYPGNPGFKTAIEAQKPPMYGLIEFSLSDDYLSSTKYDLSLFSSNVFLNSKGEVSKQDNIYKFKNWTDLFNETKPLIIPLDIQLIENIHFKIDYLY